MNDSSSSRLKLMRLTSHEQIHGFKYPMKIKRTTNQLSPFQHHQINHFPSCHLVLITIIHVLATINLQKVQAFGWTSWATNNYLQNISDCPTFDANRTGICVATANECRNRGGRRLGNCLANQGGITSNSNNLNPQYGNQGGYSNPFGYGVPIGVCCAIQKSCDETIRHNGTYFRSPGAPTPYSDSRACSVTVARQPNICQIRLDFLKFDLDRPRTGICENDRFVISGQASNSIIPPLCGYNTGQHIYVDLDPSNYGPITLSVITIGNRPRLFDIRVTYIHCNSPYKAPSNCLQYQNSLIGQIKSFNFEESQMNAGTGYLSGLDYTICFKKPPGYCSITYSVPRFQFTDAGQSIIHQSNQSPMNYQTNPGQFFGIIGSVDKDQAGAGPYDCGSDYLQLANIPLCGSRLNSQLNPQTPNPTNNAEVVDNSTGPIVARFVSNYNEVGKGFMLDYRFNPCMVAG